MANAINVSPTLRSLPRHFLSLPQRCKRPVKGVAVIQCLDVRQYFSASIAITVCRLYPRQTPLHLYFPGQGLIVHFLVKD